MITKDINNNNLSANYGTTVALPSRKWQTRIYSNGTLLNCSIKTLTITKGSCGSSEAFSIGNVISSMLTAELLDLSTDIKGREIKVEIGLDTGSLEWICVGKFMAIEVVKTAYSTSVTGYGFTTSKTLNAFTIPATLTLANIASAIQTATGCTVSFGTGITTSYELTGTIEDGTSCYGGLQILAHACGGYATDTNDGNIIIRRYDDTPTVSVSTNRMKQLPNVEEIDFTITGVSVTVTGQYTYSLTTDVAIDPDKTYYTRSGTAPDYVYTPVESPDVADIGTYYEQFPVVYTSGSPVVLFDENTNMSASVFNNVYSGIVGYAYKTGTIDLSLGDPRIEGDDVLSVTDVNGNTYIVPCHSVTHTYDGGLSTTVQAVKATSGGDGLVSNAPISQKLDLISTATAIAQASAESAVHYAQQAEQSASEAKADAQSAKEDALSAKADAQSAKEDAQRAQASASQANIYANSALDQLGIVQDVVGVLDLLSTNGEYQPTTDDTPQGGKWYFTRSGTSPNYVYSVVNGTIGYDYLKTKDVAIDPLKTYYEYDSVNDEYVEVQTPVLADIGNYYEYSDSPYLYGYYELTGIDQAVQNYVSSQLTVTNAGLWLQTAGMQTKVLLSATDGVVLYGTNGQIVGKYGNTAQVGDSAGFHIEMDGTELGFYDGANKVAYISNQQLYITQSVVLQQMDLGTMVINGGLGQWSWKIHPNGQSPSRNNLNLKWVG